MKTICVTGHRPDKLYGYDLSDIRYVELKDKLKKILIEEECTTAITGMALGVDTVFAVAVLELKKSGHDIKLHCAIPCQNHSCKWNKISIKIYNFILDKADKVTIVTDKPYQSWMMQRRNEFMVDLSDKVIAVWNGSKGGTANCIKYAQEQKKEIIRIIP